LSPPLQPSHFSSITKLGIDYTSSFVFGSISNMKHPPIFCPKKIGP
jgi:hypothetical protein